MMLLIFQLKTFVLVILLSLFTIVCTVTNIDDDHLEDVRKILPNLEHSSKGDAGRIAIIGGSVEYTGAPYFSAISALRMGADLVHVFTTHAAASVIKSYSPDLIVHPVLDVSAPDGDKVDVDKICRQLSNMDVVVIGPGLGRDDKILDVVADIITTLKSKGTPLVIDADGLYLVSKKTDLIVGYPKPGVILTPNSREMALLCDAYGVDHTTKELDFTNIRSDFISVLKKGDSDKIFSANKTLVWNVNGGGSPRRVGGQGDVLSGTLATFFHWSIKFSSDGKQNLHPAYVASFGAATITRNCNHRAFQKNGRNMLASDMIKYIHPAFNKLFAISD